MKFLVNEKLLFEKEILEILENDGEFIKNIKNPSDKMILIALKQNGIAIYYIN